MNTCTCGSRMVKVSGWGYTLGKEGHVEICGGCFAKECVCLPAN